MPSRRQQGFTLIEVVLAIAVGLIIIAGVSVGYTYAKHAAIIDTQRKDVASVRTFVEQAIASLQASAVLGAADMVPVTIVDSQLQALASRLPSLQIDPYTGVARNVGCSGGGTAPCYDASTGTAGSSYGPTMSTIPDGPASGSSVMYVKGAAFSDQFTVTLADGSTRTFFGYFVVESDADGNLVAAEGGDSSNQNGVTGGGSGSGGTL